MHTRSTGSVGSRGHAALLDGRLAPPGFMRMNAPRLFGFAIN